MHEPSTDLLTITEVAERLAISPRSVTRAVADHRLRAVRLGRSIRFRPADLDAFVAKHRGAARAVVDASGSDPVVHDEAPADGWPGFDDGDDHE